MKTEIQLIAIKETHFQDLLSLFKEFAEFEKVPERMKNSLEKMQEEKNFLNGFVAIDENQTILGYATCFFAYYTWYGKSLYMDDLYVRPAHRGKGLGTQLIQKVILYAKENKCHKLRWQVSTWNEPAIGFYKSLGAEVDDIEKNCDLLFD